MSTSGDVQYIGRYHDPQFVGSVILEKLTGASRS